MVRNEFTFPSADGRTGIHAVEWTPDMAPRAVLVLSHGVSEHILRYEPLAAYLTEWGFAVAGHDHLGHGLSVAAGAPRLYFGPRGSWDWVVQDLYTRRNLAGERYPGLPVFLLGHSGAGKSTLLKLILREETPTEGRVLVNGQDVARLRRRKIPYLRRQMGIIFQDFRLIPTMTVYENIAFAMHVTNIGHKQIKERVNYMLELVHLEDKAKVYPDLLSGGEQQRVAVARALAHAPKLVIADEPTGNIDPELSLEMMELLERVSEMGITVLVVTHEHELVRHFDRRVVTLSGGHIISDVPTGSMIPHPPVDPKELEMEVSLV